LEVVSTLLTTVEGRSFDLQYSPAIDLEYTFHQSPIQIGGGTVGGGGSGFHKLFEKVVSTVYRSSESSNSLINRYITLVKCILDTDIKAEYQDKFSEKPTP